MNQINLIGRIGMQPELKTLDSGNSVTSFNLAVKNRDKTNWIRIVAWNKTAELITKFCAKGEMIGITGRLDVRDFEVNGEKRTAYEVIAEQIHFCGSKKQDAPAQQNDFGAPVDFTDDLPF